jgi:flavin-binding protein dodecin
MSMQQPPEQGDINELNVEGTDVRTAVVGTSSESFDDAIQRAINRFYKENPDLYFERVEVDFVIVQKKFRAVIVNPPAIGEYQITVVPGPTGGG